MEWREIEVPTGTRAQLVDITGKVAAEVERSGVGNGTCVVFVPHTTAGVTINENADPAVARDILVSLSRLVPETGDYRHAEGNSDAHVKASLVGFSVTVPVVRGRIALGT
ncbi:MAG: secondary thiamine-phosphate synthase enzyme YjbQ, partial [Methanolinea sp.]